MKEALVLIPARMASTRLPGKPLADIAGLPMIVQVLRRAEEANVGPVVVATDSPDIVKAVETAGGRTILTTGDHESGTDRIAEALEKLDPDMAHDIILNLQGDLPTVEPLVLRSVLAAMDKDTVDIATAAAEITRPEERENPNVVKVVGTMTGNRLMRALYFTRATAPHGEGPLYHHIGIYAYRRAALQHFVAQGPSPLEKREKLEQLRALEENMRIEVALVETVPFGVDTPADLIRANDMLQR